MADVLAMIDPQRGATHLTGTTAPLPFGLPVQLARAAKCHPFSRPVRWGRTEPMDLSARNNPSIQSVTSAYSALGAPQRGQSQD